VCAIPLPRWIGIDPKWGVAGLTASAGIAGWVEFTLLRRTLNARIGRTGLPGSLVARLWLAAAAAAGAAWGMKTALGSRHPLIFGLAVIATYGAVYFGATWLLRVEEFAAVLRRLRRR
jgi:putative peptidoglycan lipid II flippase